MATVKFRKGIGMIENRVGMGWNGTYKLTAEVSPLWNTVRCQFLRSSSSQGVLLTHSSPNGHLQFRLIYLTANESGGNLSNKSCNGAIVESFICCLFFVCLVYIFTMLWILVDVTSRL